MADISAQIRAIQQASRGEQVRDSIVTALQAINTNIESDVIAATNRLVPDMLDTAAANAINAAKPSIVSEVTQTVIRNVQNQLPGLVSSEVATQVATAKSQLSAELTQSLTTTLTAEITRQINEKLEDGSEVEF